MAAVISHHMASASIFEYKSHSPFPFEDSPERDQQIYQTTTNTTKKYRMSPPSPSQSPPPNDSTEGGASSGKKKAGRKKVTQDGDAVERRRTQLRLAQRAYRERKETTIADLEKKTANLERALGDMYSIFSDYHDAVAVQRASPHDAQWVQDLNQVRDELNVAMQQAGVDPDGDKISERRRARASASPNPQSSMFEMDEMRRQHALQSGMSLQPSDTLGYAFGANPANESGMLASASMATHPTIGEQPSRPSKKRKTNTIAEFVYRDGRSGMAVVYSSNWLNTAHIGGPTGYLNETSSFARRLFHFCMEHCFRLLMDPRRDEEEVYEKLRWSLHFAGREAVGQALTRYLQASAKEKGLNRPPDPPVIPLGNAGTHYPRPEIMGGFSRKFRRVDASQPNNGLGLLKYVSVDPAEYPEGALKHQFSSETPWFDAYDTEMYLRERGVKFNIHSTAATIEVDLEDNTAVSTTPKTSAPPIEALRDVPIPTHNGIGDEGPDNLAFNDIDWANLGDWSMLQSSSTHAELPNVTSNFQTAAKAQSSFGGLPETTAGQLRMFGTMGDELGISNVIDPAQEGQPRPGPFTERYLKRTVTIDLDALMHLLENGAMCLGRAPGFRKSVVDDALNAVIRKAAE